MARRYADENFPLPAVEELRRLGHDVLTIQEIGRGNRSMPDDQVLAFSAGEGRILLTLNRKHFIRLHKERGKYQGMIVCTFDPDFVALAHRIDEALAQQVSFAGRLIRIQRPQEAATRASESAPADQEPGTSLEPGRSRQARAELAAREQAVRPGTIPAEPFFMVHRSAMCNPPSRCLVPRAS